MMNINNNTSKLNGLTAPQGMTMQDMWQFFEENCLTCKAVVFRKEVTNKATGMIIPQYLTVAGVIPQNEFQGEVKMVEGKPFTNGLFWIARGQGEWQGFLGHWTYGKLCQFLEKDGYKYVSSVPCVRGVKYTDVWGKAWVICKKDTQDFARVNEDRLRWCRLRNMLKDLSNIYDGSEHDNVYQYVINLMVGMED